jgi:hypothetical protein
MTTAIWFTVSTTINWLWQNWWLLLLWAALATIASLVIGPALREDDNR